MSAWGPDVPSPPQETAARRSTGQAAEDHLATTVIEAMLPFHNTDDLGQGHPAKRTLILQGGGAAIAKYAPVGDADLRQQARNEVAAWRLLTTLGWADLGITAVLRDIDVPGEGVVVSAVQTVLAGEPRQQCPAVDTFDKSSTRRAAIFDILISNTDRDGNWFGLGQPPLRLKLYDHGHAFGLHGRRVRSAFVTHHAGDSLEQSATTALQALSNAALAPLGEYLPLSAVRAVARRRDRLLAMGTVGPVAGAARRRPA